MAKRQQSPTTISKVNIIVAIHKEVATGALAVSSICLMRKVFSNSQYLLTYTGYRSPQTVRFARNFTYFRLEVELRWQFMPAQLFKKMPPYSISFLDTPTKNGGQVIMIFSIGVRVMKPLNSSTMRCGSIPKGNMPRIPLPTTTITSSITWISLMAVEYLKQRTKLNSFFIDLQTSSATTVFRPCEKRIIKVWSWRSRLISMLRWPISQQGFEFAVCLTEIDYKSIVSYSVKTLSFLFVSFFQQFLTQNMQTSTLFSQLSTQSI